MNLRLTKAKAPGIASPLHVRFTSASPGWNPRLVRETFFQTILAVAVAVLVPTVAQAGSARNRREFSGPRLGKLSGLGEGGGRYRDSFLKMSF